MSKAFIVVIATGEYFSLASAFRDSAESNGWKSVVHIVSDNNEADSVIEESSYNDIIQHMVSFAKFVPEEVSGPVVLLDADSLAIGEEPEWVEHPIAGVDKYDGREAHTPDDITPKSGVVVDGTILVFDSLGRAKDFCSAWTDNWNNEENKGHKLELLSLWRTAKQIPVFALSGDRSEPYAGKLKHLKKTANDK